MAIKFLNTVAVDTNVLYVNAATNKVGIGTTNPNQPLHVAGRAIIEDRLAIGGDFTPQKVLHLKNAAPVFRFEDSDITGGYLDMIKTSRNMRFDLEQNDATAATNFNFRIGGISQLYLRNQNVGIGEDSPGRQLTLSGNSSPIISLKSNTTGTGEPSIYFGDAVVGGDAVGRIVYSNSQDYMSFWTAAGERVRIKNDGDTGIGVQDPKAKLDVDGGVKIGNDTDAATIDKEGTLRYHVSGGYAKLDICMRQGGAGGYAWFNVIRVSMSI